MVTWLKYLWEKLTQLNFYASDEIDEDSVRQQYLSTRLLIIVVSLSMSTFLIISLLRIENQIIEVKYPSYEFYVKLINRNDINHVECRCSDVSLNYGEFARITWHYHQICSSDLVSSDWINFLFDMIKTNTTSSLAFRKTASFDFQLLRQLCQSSQRIFDDNLVTFYSKQVISNRLLNENKLDAQINASVNDLQLSVVQTLSRSLSFVRAFTTTDQLLSAANTAFVFELEKTNNDIGISAISMNYGPAGQGYCHCMTSSSCHLSTEVEDWQQNDETIFSQTKNAQLIQDWYVACWPIESVLLSSLTVFYNQSALKIIVDTNRFSALDPSKLSHFNVNTSIKELINHAFFEQLKVNIS